MSDINQSNLSLIPPDRPISASNSNRRKNLDSDQVISMILAGRVAKSSVYVPSVPFPSKYEAPRYSLLSDFDFEHLLGEVDGTLYNYKGRPELEIFEIGITDESVIKKEQCLEFGEDLKEQIQDQVTQKSENEHFNSEVVLDIQGEEVQQTTEVENIENPPTSEAKESPELLFAEDNGDNNIHLETNPPALTIITQQPLVDFSIKPKNNIKILYDHSKRLLIYSMKIEDRILNYYYRLFRPPINPLISRLGSIDEDDDDQIEEPPLLPPATTLDQTTQRLKLAKGGLELISSYFSINSLTYYTIDIFRQRLWRRFAREVILPMIYNPDRIDEMLQRFFVEEQIALQRLQGILHESDSSTDSSLVMKYKEKKKGKKKSKDKDKELKEPITPKQAKTPKNEPSKISSKSKSKSKI